MQIDQITRIALLCERRLDLTTVAPGLNSVLNRWQSTMFGGRVELLEIGCNPPGNAYFPSYPEYLRLLP